MIKISEFNPSLSISRNTPTSAHCNVIVNNTVDHKSSQQREFAVNSSSTSTASTEVISDTPIVNTDSQQSVPSTTKLYEYLAVTFSRILKNNNPTLIANLIDQSGKIILDGSSLITAISLLLNINQSLIRFTYEDPEPGCLHKINPVKNIESIKVDGRDLALVYNREYNTLTDIFGISLRKVIINQIL